MDIDGPPKVWSTFEAKKNNEAYRIKIQQITRDLMEPVVEHMTRYYLPREPMAAHGGLASDPVSLNDMQALWRKTMGGGASIVALLEEGGNERDHNIVGANITGISCQDDGEFEMREGQAYMNALKTAIAITKEGDLFKKYGVDKYLTAYGLSVHPDYHGLGIGLKLLESREYVCKAFGLQMTGTVFTAPTSQHLAKKAGFELVVEHDFKDYKVNVGVTYEGPNSQSKTERQLIHKYSWLLVRMDIDSPPMVLGRFKAEKNNRTYKIRIEHLTRNLMEQALDHMNAYFIAREPMTLNCNMTSDPVSLQELMALWRKTIEQGASLVAILEEEESDMPGNIVGVNLTGISYKDKEETTKVEGVLWANIFNVLTTITNEANLFKKYNVDKYLTGLGLSVHPDYHGLGIGFKLLEAREPLCKAIGIRMTATVFTAASSQYIASKAGFEANIEHNFKEYNINGVIHFPDLEGKLVLMVKRYN